MLKVRGLTVQRSNLELTNLSFDVNRGDILALIGPNGCGKSAILELIADPDSSYNGTISLNHFSSRENGDRYKTQLGYLPQHFLPPLHLTGYEFLEMVGSLYYLDKKNRDDRIFIMSKEFNCDQQLYRVIEHLSSADRQRIGLMATLLAEPPLLIWDEPTTFLDYETLAAAKLALKKRVASGGAAVVATNDLKLAETVASRIMILDDGQVVAEGTIAELSHHAQTPKNLGDIYLGLINS